MVTTTTLTEASVFDFVRQLDIGRKRALARSMLKTLTHSHGPISSGNPAR